MSALSEIEAGMTYPVPPDFDPLTQPIWYLRKNGTVDHPFNFHQLDTELFASAQWCVVYGCTIGAGVMTLLHVLALTPLTKRRSLIYWLNVIGLCQVIARGIIQTLFYTRDKFSTYYVMFSGDSSSVPGLHRVHSTMSVILSLTSIANVEVIFFVQGRAILSTLPRRLYLLFICGLVLCGIIAVTARLIFAVFNINDIWFWNHVERNSTLIPQWVEPTSKLSSRSRQN